MSKISHNEMKTLKKNTERQKQKRICASACCAQAQA